MLHTNRTNRAPPGQHGTPCGTPPSGAPEQSTVDNVDNVWVQSCAQTFCWFLSRTASGRCILRVKTSPSPRGCDLSAALFASDVLRVL